MAWSSGVILINYRSESPANWRATSGRSYDNVSTIVMHFARHVTRHNCQTERFYRTVSVKQPPPLRDVSNSCEKHPWKMEDKMGIFLREVSTGSRHIASAMPAALFCHLLQRVSANIQRPAISWISACDWNWFAHVGHISISSRVSAAAAVSLGEPTARTMTLDPRRRNATAFSCAKILVCSRNAKN